MLRHLFVIFLAMSACRTERICDFEMEGICFNTRKDCEISREMIQITLDIARDEFYQEFGISFSWKKLANNENLYVIYLPYEELWQEDSSCVLGCYTWGFEEIRVGYWPQCNPGDAIYFYQSVLAHELLHFLSHQILFDRNFANEKSETEHNTLGIWEGRNGKESIDTRIDQRLFEIYENQLKEGNSNG